MTQGDDEARLGRFLLANGVRAEHLRFDAPTRSVAEAAAAVGGKPEDFVKSVCLLADDGALVVAVVAGEDRVSRRRVGEALGAPPPRVASPDEVLRRTGYPAGGTPPFGYPATVLVDPRVLERAAVYAGGGSTRALLRLAPEEILRASRGRVVDVREG